MSRSYDDYEGHMETALKAIIARIVGEFDNPALIEMGGPLSADTLADVKLLAEKGLP